MLNIFVNEKSEMFPIKLSIAYILVTLFISVAGPIEFLGNDYKKHLSIIYVSLIVIFMFIGYCLGLHIKRNSLPNDYDFNASRNRTYRLITSSQNIALVSIGLEFIYLVVTKRFSFSILNVGLTYMNIDRTGGGSTNLIMLFRFSTAFFRVAAVSLGFFYYRESSKNSRIRTIICAIGIFLIFLFGYGTQNGIAYIFIELAVAVMANMIRKNRRVSKKTVRIILISGIAVTFLFAFMQYSRFNAIGINASNYHLYSTGEYKYNTDHIIFKIFGDKLGFGFATILGNYMSLGYYGLSLCLQIPFEWTFGVGNSYALILLLEKIGITGILEKTYLLRMQERFGRRGLTSWNTIFPWLASDYGWIGTLFVFLVIGAIFAFAWKDVLRHRNPFSFLVVVMLMILVLFIPANNSIMHGYDTFMTTIFVALGWLFLRKKYNWD